VLATLVAASAFAASHGGKQEAQVSGSEGPKAAAGTKHLKKTHGVDKKAK
jgi:hypothetical protein